MDLKTYNEAIKYIVDEYLAITTDPKNEYSHTTNYEEKIKDILSETESDISFDKINKGILEKKDKKEITKYLMEKLPSEKSKEIFNHEELDLLTTIFSDDDSEDGNAKKREAYAKLVSDNYSDNNAVTVEKQSTTMHGGDTKDIEFDESEMTIKQKTRLAFNGKTVSIKDTNEHRLDEFYNTKDERLPTFDNMYYKNAECSDKKYICGGVLTFKETEPTQDVGGPHSTIQGVVTYDTEEQGWISPVIRGNVNEVAITDPEQMGQIVHYEGVLGSFDYNTRMFELAYYESKIPGTNNTARVPFLHYIGDKEIDCVDFRHGGSKTLSITNGDRIEIPEGLKCADYMFAGTNVKTVPKLPDSLESAHCMFDGCKNLEGISDNAKNSNGDLNYPDKLKDISWMFAGSNVRYFFNELKEDCVDARCAAQDCKQLGYADDGSNTFKMPATTKPRMLTGAFANDMFDNTDSRVIDIVKKACKNKTDNLGRTAIISPWTAEDGSHNNILDKIVDGSYDKDAIKKMKSEEEKRQKLKDIDPTSKGTGGVESDTNGLATTSTHDTKTGTIQNNSTWASMTQSDRTFHKTEAKDDTLDRVLGFGTVFGGVKLITSLASNFIPIPVSKKIKSLVTTGIALACAAVPQFTGGTFQKVSPLMDNATNLLDLMGKDNDLSKLLKQTSKALKEKDVTYTTEINEINIENAFQDQKTSSIKFAKSQLSALLKSTNNDVLNREYASGMNYSMASCMSGSGKNMAHDGNLITLALTKDNDIKYQIDTLFVNASMQNVKNIVDEYSINGVMLDENKTIISSGFIQYAKNMKTYSDSMRKELNDKYYNDNDAKDMAINGAEKIMKNGCESFYKMMYTVQKENSVLSEDDIATIDANTPMGVPKFSEYQKAMADAEKNEKTTKINDTFSVTKDGDIIIKDIDRYVTQMEKTKKSYKEALAEAKDTTEKNKILTEMNNKIYGYLIDEATAQDVKLDETSQREIPEVEDESKSDDQLSL